MIYPRLYTEADHGRWIDIIDPCHPDTEVKYCISDALKIINLLEDFKIVFRNKDGTFTKQVRYERINGKMD